MFASQTEYLDKSWLLPAGVNSKSASSTKFKLSSCDKLLGDFDVT